jgi:hypothetical protein
LIGLSAPIAEPVCARLAGQGQLQDRLVEVVLEALKKREPARLSWGTGVANFVLNRRQFTPRGVILGMNARGPADRTVPVLRIDTAEGKLRAILFGAATHNTTLRANCYEICGDYAGFAQANLAENYPGVQAMFILGFAGDSDPYPHGTMDLARKHGRELSEEVERVLETKLTPVRGPLRLSFDKAPSMSMGKRWSLPREGGELPAVQQVVTDGGRTDAFEFEVLFHPIAKLTHCGISLVKEVRKTKESSIKIVSNRASKTSRNQKLPPTYKLPLRLRSTDRTLTARMTRLHANGTLGERTDPRCVPLATQGGPQQWGVGG